jgi:uncharacterized protein with GYD domain
MAKYMIQASYTAEGVKGLLGDGGSKRRAAAEGLVTSLGGTMEAFYYSFGDNDAFIIVDVPDNASAAAASLAVTASGAVTTKTTVLLTAEEIDEATQKATDYAPPGQ